MRLELAVLRKHFTGGYNQTFAQDSFVLRVWRRHVCPFGVVPFWFDTIVL